MNPTDYVPAIQQLGFPAALCLGFLWCFFQLGKLLITFLTTVHQSHEKEREKWYEGVSKSVTAATQYLREEHVEIMAILKGIKG